MGQVDALKKKYNETLTRFRKAGEYMDDKSIPLNEREKHLPAFRKLLKECGDLTNKLKAAGVTYTREQILNGFDDMEE
jgi:hypothetical protein